MITNFKLFESNNNSDQTNIIKQIKKDINISKILKRNFENLNDINLDEFYKSIKNLFFNNILIKDYFKDNDLFKNLRQHKLEQYTFNTLLHISDLIKEYINSQKINTKISADSRKDLLKFINSEYSHKLYNFTVSELKNVDNIRPTENVVLYRGLLFSHNSDYAKNIFFNFINSIKKGTDVLNLKNDKVTSWTYNINIADNFAKNKSASSSFVATLNFLRNENYIQGYLGVIISTIAKPKDIIIDFTKYDISNLKGFAIHGDEKEVILDAGDYLCRIVKLYDKNGEVDVKTFFDNFINNEDLFNKLNEK